MVPGANPRRPEPGEKKTRIGSTPPCSLLGPTPTPSCQGRPVPASGGMEQTDRPVVVTIMGVVAPGPSRKQTSTFSCPSRDSPPFVPCRRPGPGSTAPAAQTWGPPPRTHGPASQAQEQGSQTREREQAQGCGVRGAGPEHGARRCPLPSVGQSPALALAALPYALRCTTSRGHHLVA